MSQEKFEKTCLRLIFVAVVLMTWAFLAWFCLAIWHRYLAE